MKKTILCLVLSMLIFSGCAAKVTSEEEVKDANKVVEGVDTSKEEATVESFITYFKDLDFQSMYELTDTGDAYYADAYRSDNAFNKRLFEAVAEDLEYEIVKSEATETAINVFVNCKTINMEKLMPQIVNEYKDRLLEAGEQADPNAILDELITEKLSSPDLERVEKNTVFNFVKKDDNWVIESNVGIYDDLCGGYLQYMFNNYVGSVAYATKQ
ncbi:MAG: hypothetical protein IJS61_05665 [Firmicutes bacterium]|nr:hypothetical protein [Bacillota bacterium]